MNFWTPAEFQRITQGRWLNEPADLSHRLRGLSIDSRTIANGHVFVAIKGENFDGHDYVTKSLEQYAFLAIIERDDNWRPTPIGHDHGILLVNDCVKALQMLACAYRDILAEHDVKVIGVTGSNGKTTARHLIHTVLSAEFKCTQSPKSFNNHLGVPLTILGASVDDDFLIAEVGTNHPGEIDLLGAILRPDVSVTTSIGEEHLEGFGDIEGVKREESAIFKHVRDGGTVIIPTQGCGQDILDVPPRKGIKLIRTGIAHQQSSLPGDYIAVDCNEQQSPESPLRFTIENRLFQANLFGFHQLGSIILAIAVAREFGMKWGHIMDAVADAEPMPGRMEVMQFGEGLTVINDSYNSNPPSLNAALASLAWLQGRRKVAILADMLELGERSQALHADAAHAMTWHFTEGGGIDQFIMIGPMMQHMSDAMGHVSGKYEKEIHYLPTMQNGEVRRIVDLLQPNDIVLLKGSRGMELERLIPAIEQNFGKPKE